MLDWKSFRFIRDLLHANRLVTSIHILSFQEIKQRRSGDQALALVLAMKVNKKC